MFPVDDCSVTIGLIMELFEYKYCNTYGICYGLAYTGNIEDMVKDIKKMCLNPGINTGDVPKQIQDFVDTCETEHVLSSGLFYNYYTEIHEGKMRICNTHDLYRLICRLGDVDKYKLLSDIIPTPIDLELLCTSKRNIFEHILENHEVNAHELGKLVCKNGNLSMLRWLVEQGKIDDEHLDEYINISTKNNHTSLVEFMSEDKYYQQYVPISHYLR
jgi:hypothetical protein